MERSNISNNLFSTGHRFDPETPIAETVSSNLLINLPMTPPKDEIKIRCKRFMTLSRLDMPGTSGCLPAGRGNVSLPVVKEIRFPVPVKHAPNHDRLMAHCSPCYAECVSSRAHWNDTVCLPFSSCWNSDYAINNKLTPFISMQNQYSLIYREEEREMFPTLKVLFLYLTEFALIIFL